MSEFLGKAKAFLAANAGSVNFGSSEDPFIKIDKNGKILFCYNDGNITVDVIEQWDNSVDEWLDSQSSNVPNGTLFLKEEDSKLKCGLKKSDGVFVSFFEIVYDDVRHIYKFEWMPTVEAESLYEQWYSNRRRYSEMAVTFQTIEYVIKESGENIVFSVNHVNPLARIYDIIDRSAFKDSLEPNIAKWPDKKIKIY